MRVGVLGAGRVGAGLAGRFAAAGHDVATAGRDPGAVAAAIDGADAVLLAVPAAAAVELARRHAAALEGLAVIDATNDVSRGLPDIAGAVARAAPGAHVVKAFNTVFAAIYDDVAAAPGTADMALCGDDPGAKAKAAELVEAAGFRPVDCGGLEAAPDLEGFARMVIRTAYQVGRGPFAYRFGAVDELR